MYESESLFILEKAYTDSIRHRPFCDTYLQFQLLHRNHLMALAQVPARVLVPVDTAEYRQ